MKKFEYICPDNIETAQLALESKDKYARVIAGGTDILGTLKNQISSHYPDLLVSLKNAGLSYIREDTGGIRIGAMTTLHEVVKTKAVRERFPLLYQAAYSVASPQIRHQATIGGNICQEPRCWYYRYPDNKFHCMRKGGKQCDAMTGNNLYHSIFGAANVCDPPCKKECPNGAYIPEYIEKLRKGDVIDAASILLEVSPLASVTGRVCPHTCEDMCNRRDFDESVSIRDIEKQLGDFVLDNYKELTGPPAEETGKKVAIAGAGPAGLTAAYFLRKAGHSVTVYDGNDKPGGMLSYGIPAYRLPRDIIEKTCAMLSGMGVVFKLMAGIGDDIALATLQKDHDAVLLAIGAWDPVKTGCPGEDAEGVFSGIEFLFHAAKSEETGIGKTVAVVGGGNTAMDAARTALRLGAEKVYNFYRRTESEMPADAEELTEAAEEGVDFRYLVAPIEIIKDTKGRVCRVILQKMKSGELDDSGRRRPVPVEGQTEIVDIDTLIIAVGQRANTNGLPGIGKSGESVIEANRTNHKTSFDKVFAAGDSAIGSGIAAAAIADARDAAEAIDMFLDGISKRKRADEKGTLSFDPDAVNFSKRSGDMLNEANRCFNCGCIAVSPSDIAPALIALDADMITTQRKISAGAFFRVGIESSTVLEGGEILKEIFIPTKASSEFQLYQKFRIRKTIDFPVIGLAANIRISRNVIESAKLVLNAAAPNPYVLSETEKYLAGKEPNEETAVEAGKQAVSDALPFANNAFKVQILKTLVKRAVMKSGL